MMDNAMSKVIQFLRLPLMVTIVMIHAYIKEYDISNPEIPYSFMGAVQYFFSNIVSQVAIPIFFCFSGYLFFLKIQKLDGQTYWNKLKSRFHSLFVPYVIWNLLYVFIYYVAQATSLMPADLSGKHKLVVDYTLYDWLSVFWNIHGGLFPMDTPLWFIRDLMLAVLLAPLLYFCLTRFKYWFVLLLGIPWFCGISGQILSSATFFYFSLGAYYGIYKKSMIVSGKIGGVLMAIYALCMALEMYFYDGEYIAYFRRLCVIVGIYATLFLSDCLIRVKSWKISPFWSDSSFFIYAYHAVFLVMLQKCCFLFVPLQNEYGALCVYFFSVACAVCFGAVLNWLLKKMLPRVASVLLGER